MTPEQLRAIGAQSPLRNLLEALEILRSDVLDETVLAHIELQAFFFALQSGRVGALTPNRHRLGRRGMFAYSLAIGRARMRCARKGLSVSLRSNPAMTATPGLN